MSDEPYTYVWEYEVPPEAQAEFVTHYAPDGTWAMLFRRAPGYLGTELYRDRSRPDRFVTVDHWESETAFRRFRARYAAEFETLDRECERLTRREAPLGELRPVTGGRAQEARAHTMKRRIVGFHLDEEEHWVAELECGHTQHVRHDPPWQVRAWVTTPEGRRSRLGTPLECRRCAEGE